MGDKYRNFSSSNGRITLGLGDAMVSVITAREADIRKLTDSKEIFATLSTLYNAPTVDITAKALNQYVTVGRFSMQQMPGCCGVVVSYHSQIEQQFRKRGLGTLFLEIREEAARRAGYSCIIGTVLDDNKVEKTMLLKAGWRLMAQIDAANKPVYSFRNSRTKHDVQFWTKHLTEEE